MQILIHALEVADRMKEDRAQCLVRWDLCHAILLGGEGPNYRVNRVLQLVKQVVLQNLCKAKSFGSS